MNAITEHVDYSNHFVVDDHVVIENDDIDDDTMSIVDVTNSVQVSLSFFFLSGIETARALRV